MSVSTIRCGPSHKRSETRCRYHYMWALTKLMRGWAQILNLQRRYFLKQRIVYCFDCFGTNFDIGWTTCCGWMWISNQVITSLYSNFTNDVWMPRSTVHDLGICSNTVSIFKWNFSNYLVLLCSECFNVKFKRLTKFQGIIIIHNMKMTYTKLQAQRA